MSMQKPVPIAELDRLELVPAAAIGGVAVELTFTLSAHSGASQ
jgi:hypothetical protein